METAQTTKMTTEQVMIKMMTDRWNGLLKNFNAKLDAMSDEQLMQPVAPGRNRGVYLLGHLTAVHDDMMRLLDFGALLFPALKEPFLTSPDNAAAEIPSAAELRAAWYKMNEVLGEKMNSLQPSDWFAKHTAVSEEEFANEPHRNKLNILLTRTTHLSYHAGQMMLLH